MFLPFDLQKYLIENGADTTARNNNGMAPRKYADFIEASERAREQLERARAQEWAQAREREREQEREKERRTGIGATIAEVKSVLGEPSDTITRTTSEGTTATLHYRVGNSAVICYIRGGRVVEVETRQ